MTAGDGGKRQKRRSRAGRRGGGGSMPVQAAVDPIDEAVCESEKSKCLRQKCAPRRKGDDSERDTGRHAFISARTLGEMGCGRKDDVQTGPPAHLPEENRQREDGPGSH